MRAGFLFLGTCLLLGVGVGAGSGCSSKDDHPPAVSEGNGSGGSTNPDGGSSAGVLTNCGANMCRGHGHCVGTGNTASCVCDEGYVLKDGGDPSSGYDCVVDESCIRLKYLQKDSCRYEANGAPAVGLFFAVDYCAGTAVLPSELGNLDQAFSVKEDKLDVRSQTESHATVIPRSVESYVTIAIDFSSSLTDQKDLLSGLVGKLRKVIGDLARPAGEPPVGVSILVFGRFVAEHLGWTTDLTAVDQALSDLETNVGAVSALVDGGGTSLHEAVKRGIQQTERIQGLRDVVTEGGVLTTGTLVIVTDGKDTSAAALDEAQLDATLVNVMSIGISSEIDDADLTNIGRDGSFLAPTPDDWAPAFDEVTLRVKNYPKRAYLLGYCSSSVTGQHTVEVGLVTGQAKATASCTFDADRFGGQGSGSCNEQTFTESCTGKCGGLIACGACADGECCAGGTCVAPSGVAGDCRGQDELCLTSGDVCVADTGASTPADHCVAAVPVGGTCGPDTHCTLGSYCEGTVCTAIALTNGDVCGDVGDHPADVCPERNCAQQKPVPGQPYLCLPGARAFDRCSGETASAVCETGTACQNDVCTLRHSIGCETDLDCGSGFCEVGLCRTTSACYFAWDQKLTR